MPCLLLGLGLGPHVCRFAARGSRRESLLKN